MNEPQQYVVVVVPVEANVLDDRLHGLLDRQRALLLAARRAAPRRTYTSTGTLSMSVSQREKLNYRDATHLKKGFCLNCFCCKLC